METFWGACVVLGLAGASAFGQFRYQTSWVGNSLGGAKWVQASVQGMFVTPDGTVFCATPWEPSGKEVGIYKNGDAVGFCEGLHTGSRSGGRAVVADDQFIYVAMAQAYDAAAGVGGLNANGKAKFPAKGNVWHCVRRYTRNGKPARFATGAGFDGSMLLINDVPAAQAAAITGLALDTDAAKLFVSDPAHSQIHLFNVSSNAIALAADWALPEAGPLVSDRHGGVWAIYRPPPSRATRIAHLTVTGAKEPNEITTLTNAAALAWGPQGHLLVADDGPNQQVQIFTPSAAPTIVETIGDQGGLFKATPGLVEPLTRLDHPVGLGVDAQGLRIVACAGNGTDLRAFKPQSTNAWRLLAVGAMGSVDFDQSTDGQQLFSVAQKFAFDYKQPAGKNWRFVAATLNPLRFPQDPRLFTRQASACLRFIQGMPYLYTTDADGAVLCVFRFDGEIAVPCAMFARRHLTAKPAWPPAQPATGAWLWLDKNGDGAFQADEYDSAPADDPPAWCWHVTSNGDIWTPRDRTNLFCLRWQGFDSKTAPVYSRQNTTNLAVPPDLFTAIQRVEFDAGETNVFISGFTKARPSAGDPSAMGGELMAFEKNEDGLQLLWRQPLEADTLRKRFAKAMCVRDGLVFVAWSDLGDVKVIEAATGRLIATLRPGPEVNSQGGPIDLCQGLRAYRRNDGEYVVAVEDSLKSKNLIYRFKLAAGR